MENHEENNIQQEIIDSLAKKMNDIEKRQSKIEGLNLAELPSKVQEMENKFVEIANMRILENTGQIQKFDSQLATFDEKLIAIPKAIPMKHEFDPKSKFVIRMVVGFGIAVAIMLAVTISLWIENNRRGDEANKFLILRGFYPDVAKYIDSAYINNEDFFIKKAKANIDEQQAMSEKAFNKKQADEERKLKSSKTQRVQKKRAYSR